MKYFYLITILIFLNCSSEENKANNTLSDTSYEVQFSPCTCRRDDFIVHAKKTIVLQGVKDYEQFHSQKLEPELETKIIEEDYENFLYDFSLDTKSKADIETGKETVTAVGKVKQNEINQFVENNPLKNQSKISNTQTGEYHSKGLDVIKGFKSDRKKRQTVEEISKSRPVILYEIKRK